MLSLTLFDREGREGYSSANKTYSPGAHSVMVHAVSDALKRRHEYIGSEHILAGVLREGSVIPLLEKMRGERGPVVEGIMQKISYLVNDGPEITSPSELMITPLAIRRLSLAYEEARSLDLPHVDPIAITLGLMRGLVVRGTSEKAIESYFGMSNREVYQRTKDIYSTQLLRTRLESGMSPEELDRVRTGLGITQ